MAEVIDSMPPKWGSRHPWDEWLDGRVWKLTRGTDYDCDEAALADRARCAARRRGLRVEVSISRRRQVVYVHATGPAPHSDWIGRGIPDAAGN